MRIFDKDLHVHSRLRYVARSISTRTNLRRKVVKMRYEEMDSGGSIAKQFRFDRSISSSLTTCKTISGKKFPIRI